MAGSRRWFQYNDDNGIGWAVQLDESNAESPGLGFSVIDATVATAGRRITRNNPIRMRYVLASAVIGGVLVSRKFYVGAIEADAWGATSVTVSGQAYTVTYRSGEAQKYIPPADTAQLDGDTDSNLAAGPAAP